MIGENVEKMGVNPFAGCYNLKFYASMLHSFLKANGRYLFDLQTGKLNSYTGTSEEDIFIVPEEITHIGIASFYGASWLQHKIIPDHVQQIGLFAFLECGNLISDQIGSGVRSVGDNPFGGCWSIYEIEVDA